ncbi:hypothetical protein [Leucobacter sp. Z1108]
MTALGASRPFPGAGTAEALRVLSTELTMLAAPPTRLHRTDYGEAM